MGSELASALQGREPRALRWVSAESCSLEASGSGLVIWLSSEQLDGSLTEMVRALSPLGPCVPRWP